MHLTPAQARRFLLAYQGLWPADEFRGKAGILAHIRRVGCIQYDPLNVVGHNPDLVRKLPASPNRSISAPRINPGWTRP
jgi:uncharacterized protein